ncbi:hypothetical protein FE697_010015 [Mumia zhuanghuii]|uniref:Uncharacterized protein n=2 Tax=Mumia TaxID=1546255 RepID=A0ABW1QNG0_9ACTN|nr:MULTISPECIES: hypothetical protein [Mumia]KAA1423881.1 hypothetical protein FE697_010015 [Mumia zhuanghuii]
MPADILDAMASSPSPILADFLADVQPDRTARTQRAYAAVVLHLQRYLDTDDMSPHLGTHDGTLLAHEREVAGAEGSFFRLFGPGELLCCLPGFLEGPWLETTPHPRSHVALTARLLRHLDRRGFVGSAYRCAWYDAEDAVRRARQTARGTAP